MPPLRLNQRKIVAVLRLSRRAMLLIDSPAWRLDQISSSSASVVGLPLSWVRIGLHLALAFYQNVALTG
jgi:hypothetical protein